MERYSKAHLSDDISVQGFGRQYRPLEERLNQIENELPVLQDEVASGRSSSCPVTKS